MFKAVVENGEGIEMKFQWMGGRGRGLGLLGIDFFRIVYFL